MAPILPAATVVLIREAASSPEVLMLRRSREVSFAKGLWVFPGGKIDQADYRDNLEDITAAARYAAIRETLEETRLTVEESSLVYLSHWTTPAGGPKRFATWFFIAPIDSAIANEAVVVDGSEILEARWCHPAEALADYRAGLIDMLPPTLSTLSELSGCESVADALVTNSGQGPRKRLPQFTLTAEGIEISNPRSASLPVQDHTSYVLAEPWRLHDRES